MQVWQLCQSLGATRGGPPPFKFGLPFILFYKMAQRPRQSTDFRAHHTAETRCGPSKQQYAGALSTEHGLDTREAATAAVDYAKAKLDSQHGQGPFVLASEVPQSVFVA